jgi:hypothetical protein
MGKREFCKNIWIDNAVKDIIVHGKVLNPATDNSDKNNWEKLISFRHHRMDTPYVLRFGSLSHCIHLYSSECIPAPASVYIGILLLTRV